MDTYSKLREQSRNPLEQRHILCTCTHLGGGFMKHN